VRPGRIPERKCALGAQLRLPGGRRDVSAGERLLGLQARDGVEVAEDRGELLGGPRLAAVAPALGEAGQAQLAAGLVLGDREVTGRGVAVAGATGGAQPEAPARDDNGVAVVADLAHLEDGRLATPAHGVLPSTVPTGGTCCACGEKVELDGISAAIEWF